MLRSPLNLPVTVLMSVTAPAPGASTAPPGLKPAQETGAPLQDQPPGKELEVTTTTFTHPLARGPGRPSGTPS